MSSRQAAWVFAPALGAPIAHAPILRWDLFKGLRRPISRRLFGENKTWRGAIVMTTGSTFAALALSRLPAYKRRLPPEIAEAEPALVGALLGMAMWVGELPNSFVKRRLGIPPGQQQRSPLGALISFYDQADWVPVACLLLRPIWRMGPRDVGETFLLVAVLHVPINAAGYLIGARTNPI